MTDASPAVAGAPTAPSLVRTVPDLASLLRWSSATGQRALREDPGYALHAAWRATLGSLAPKPFVLVRRPGSLQLIGYSAASAAALAEACTAAVLVDPLAARALGLDRAADCIVRPLPQRFCVGETLSFEVRVAPVVRSRSASGGGYPEIDAAFHPAYAGDALGDRDMAHRRWLQRELARDGAASLLALRVHAYVLSPVARRAQVAGTTARTTAAGLLPDLTVRGQLRVDDPQAFVRLLARGLGRHRSFGFGCLLIAPAGAWS